MATWESRGMVLRSSPPQISDGSEPMKQYQLLSSREAQHHLTETQQVHLVVQNN